MTSLAEEFLSKRRERKPNFSDAEIGIILEGVCEHKDVLSHQENSITLNKQKMDVYNQITTKVNRVTAAEYGGSVLRTPKEVKKKWMELKFTALKIHNSAVDTDTEQKHVPKESPHTQLVLDILSGKARSGTTDFQLGYNSSNRSCPGKVGDSESDLPVSLSSFPSADDSENSECIVSDGESSIDNKHQQNLPVVKHSKNKEEQTLENPASEDQDLNTPSSETENIISDVFSHLEIETLLREVNKHRSILLNGDQQSASGKQQHKVTWELITESVRKASKTGILPTISQIQRLWRELKRQACKELKASRNDKTLDGKAHIWPRYTDQVLAILDGNCDDISDVQGLDFETMMSLEASSEQELSLPQHPDRYVLATSEDQLERKRRTRKPNFTEAEVSCMLDEIPRHYRILLSTPRTGNILRLKQKRWQMIAERVSKVSDSGVRRSWREVRKKFKALCTFAQANKNSKQSDNPSYLSCSKDSKFFQRVLEIQAVASIGVTPPEMEDFDSVEMEVEKERQKMEMEDFDSVEMEVEKERQTETLLKRRRERKKNFTNDDIKHLIEECCKHRSALVVKERDELTNRRRNQAWRIITETVNKKMKGVRRTAKELKKKFMDMKFAVVQYTNCDESESDAPWRKPPPYFSQLVTFLFPSKEDTQGLGNENYCDLENEFIIAANEDKSSTDNTSSVDNSANDDRTSDDCDHSSQDATVSGTVEGTDALSLQQSSHHWESPLEHYSGKKKRNRKPNFTAQEIACILDVWNANRELLSQKHSNMAVVSEKYKIFQMMADKVNQSSDSNTVRTALEVKKKWKHLKFVAVKAWLARQDAISKGKKPPKKVPFMNRIVENISGESMLDHDQDDKSTEDSDSDIGTRAERAKKEHGAMVKRHMKRLSDICEKLRACGVRAGAIIIETNGIMSCGEEATRISKLPEVAAVISGLPCATEPQTDESVVCGGWRYTSLEKVREHPVTLAVESKEENDFKDGSSGEDIPKVELAAKLLVKSDEEGSEEFDDNRSSDEDCKKHILSQNVSMTTTDDQELILDVKEKLRLLLQNRPMSMEEELTDSQHMPTEEKDQKNVATPPKEMETNIATSLSDIDHCTITVKTEKEMNYICGWCNKMFLELSSFMLHTQQEKYLRVCCSKCDSKFCDLLDLRQHEASAHEKLPPEPGEKNPIVVLEKLSESTISTATNCQDPSPQPSRQGRFGCSECGLCFLKMDILLQHRRTHTQERPFGCTLCDLRFKLEATLDAHKKMHATNIPYNCHVCGQQCNTGAELVLHKQDQGCAKVYLPRSEEDDADPEKQKIKNRGSTSLLPERRFSCGICGKRFLKAGHLGQHLRLHTGSKPFSCDQCDATFTQHGGLLLHKKTKHHPVQDVADVKSSDLQPGQSYLEDVGDDDCIIIQESEVDSSQLTSQDDDQFKETFNNGVDVRTRRYGCEFCGKRFYTSSHLRQHVRIHTGERPFKCDICGFRFTQSTSLTIHKRKHTGERPYSCDLCGYSFYCSSDVLSHKKKRHGLATAKREAEQGDKYRCDLCGQVFPDTTRLKVHTRKHTGEKPFACDLCDRKFSEKHNLLRHRDRHLGIKAFQCEVCGAKFTEKGNLKVHMRYHTGEKPFKCEFCGEAFYVTSTLKIHRRKHTGERPFLCDLCGAAFTQGSKLRSHRRKHTGEKPYKCQECGETFKEKQQLNIHNRKHTGEQPYRCSVCGKATQKASHLAVHMRLHTGERPYKCEVCGESFARSDVLKLHMRKHSSDPQSFGQIPMSDHASSGLELVLPGTQVDLPPHTAVPSGYSQL